MSAEDVSKHNGAGDDSPGTEDRRTARRVVEEFRRGDPLVMQEVQHRVERIIAYSGFHIPFAEQEELRQEVLTQLWQGVNRDGFDRDRGFWGFVQTVASRRCIDWMRAQRTQEPVELELVADERGGPLKRVLVRERKQALALAIDQLSVECRELVHLRIAEEKSYEQIAQELGRSEQALRAQMYRCVKKARAFLDNAEGEHEPS